MRSGMLDAFFVRFFWRFFCSFSHAILVILTTIPLVVYAKAKISSPIARNSAGKSLRRETTTAFSVRSINSTTTRFSRRRSLPCSTASISVRAVSFAAPFSRTTPSAEVSAAGIRRNPSSLDGSIPSAARKRPKASWNSSKPSRLSPTWIISTVAIAIMRIT